MKIYLISTVTIIFVLTNTLLHAGNLDIPNRFSAGTPAVAAEVNENFDSTTTEINDNYARITKNIDAIENIQLISGPPGLPGPKGDTGLQGPQGIPGPAGGVINNLQQLSVTLKRPEFISQFSTKSLQTLACSGDVSASGTINIGGSLTGSIVGLLGSASMSELYEYSVLFETLDSLKSGSLVGSSVTVSITNSKSTYIITGMVDRLSSSINSTGENVYVATIVPSLSQLGYFSGYRIFQNSNKPDIIKNLFQQRGLNGFNELLTSSYEISEFEMMYNESEFNFISRLLESEGIFYYFSPNASGDILVLGDSVSSYADSGVSLEFNGNDAGVQGGQTLNNFHLVNNSAVASYSVDSYNFKTPGVDLKSTSSGIGLGEKYQYDSSLQILSATSSAADVGLQRSHSLDSYFVATSTIPRLIPGYSVSINDLASSFSGNYLVTEVRHVFISDPVNKCSTYANMFSGIPITTIFRPQITAQKPKVSGITTAVVTGPSGENRYTDEFGRIKVQFHWDQEGQNNENSSAWLRVMVPADRYHLTNTSLGKNLFIPETGSEVVVSFINGDSSRPVVLGSLYNAIHTAPLPLPASKNILVYPPVLEGVFNMHITRIAGIEGGSKLSAYEKRNGTIEFFTDGTCTYSEADVYKLLQSNDLTNPDYNRHVVITSLLSDTCTYSLVDSTNVTISFASGGYTADVSFDIEFTLGAGTAHKESVTGSTKSVEAINLIKKITLPN